MQPALKNAVRKLTIIPLLTHPLPKLRARRPRIVNLARVPAASLLSGVSVRTLSPVMRPPSCALPDLELEHAEMVTRERVYESVVVLVVSVRREVTMERGEVVERSIGIAVGTDGVE